MEENILEEVRKVYKFDGETEILLDSMSEIKQGDIFRLEEPTGEPVFWKEEKTAIFKAKTDAFLHGQESKAWTVECDPVPMVPEGTAEYNQYYGN